MSKKRSQQPSDYERALARLRICVPKFFAGREQKALDLIMKGVETQMEHPNFERALFIALLSRANDPLFAKADRHILETFIKGGAYPVLMFAEWRGHHLAICELLPSNMDGIYADDLKLYAERFLDEIQNGKPVELYDKIG